MVRLYRLLYDHSSVVATQLGQSGASTARRPISEVFLPFNPYQFCLATLLRQAQSTWPIVKAGNPFSSANIDAGADFLPVVINCSIERKNSEIMACAVRPSV